MTGYDPLHPAPRSPAPWTAGRIVAAVISGLVGIPFLVIAGQVAGSVLHLIHDPHGYSLIFGSIALAILGFLLLCIAPWAFPPRRRGFAFAIGGGALVLMVAALYLVLQNG